MTDMMCVARSSQATHTVASSNLRRVLRICDAHHCVYPGLWTRLTYVGSQRLCHTNVFNTLSTSYSDGRAMQITKARLLFSLMALSPKRSSLPFSNSHAHSLSHSLSHSISLSLFFSPFLLQLRQTHTRWRYLNLVSDRRSTLSFCFCWLLRLSLSLGH